MKLQKVSQTITPFAGISFVHEEFNKFGLSNLIDNYPGIKKRVYLCVKKAMAYKKRGKLQCSEKECNQLEKISRSKTQEFRKVQRSTIFLMYMDNKPVSEIATTVELSRESVYANIDKALAFGPIAALNDLAGRGVSAEISDEDKAWVVNLAYFSPKDTFMQTNCGPIVYYPGTLRKIVWQKVTRG